MGRDKVDESARWRNVAYENALRGPPLHMRLESALITTVFG